MLSSGKFIQFRIERRHMSNNIEPRKTIERRQSLGNLLFRVLAGSLEWRDVAVAEPSPVSFLDLPDPAMKIHESKSRTEFPDLVMGFMIAGEHPEPLPQRRQNLPATI